jgi:hypothetical protein
MSACDICSVRNNNIDRKETHMKQWITEHILTAEDLFREETRPISNQEFYTTLSLILGSLSILVVLVHL